MSDLPTLVCTIAQQRHAAKRPAVAHAVAAALKREEADAQLEDEKEASAKETWFCEQ